MSFEIANWFVLFIEIWFHLIRWSCPHWVTEYRTFFLCILWWQICEREFGSSSIWSISTINMLFPNFESFALLLFIHCQRFVHNCWLSYNSNNSDKVCENERFLCTNTKFCLNPWDLSVSKQNILIGGGSSNFFQIKRALFCAEKAHKYLSQNLTT